MLLILTGDFGSGQRTTAQAQERPNIVVILTDDMREDDLEHMPKTNTLLVDSGLLFENAFVTNSLCCPSRATILSGLYSHNHRIISNKPPEGGFAQWRASGLEKKTVAVRLREAGYKTAYFGKYLNGYCNANAGCKEPRYVPPGWSEWHGWVGGTRMNDDGTLRNLGDGTVIDDAIRRKVGGFFSRWGQAKPIFLYVSTRAPHGKAIVAERHADLFADEQAPRSPAYNEMDISDKPAYVRSQQPLSDLSAAKLDEYQRYRLKTLQAADDVLGRVVAELEERGELANTYLFFTSDNGYEMGEHRLTHLKTTPYEESIGVPLAVRGPGVSAGQTADALVLNNDLAPTFADLAGLRFGGDGRSLVPLLSGEQLPWRDAFLVENWHDNSYPSAPTYKAVRTTSHLYVQYGSGERELYDLTADPHELENLAGREAYATLQAELRARLKALKGCVGGACRIAEAGR